MTPHRFGFAMFGLLTAVASAGGQSGSIRGTIRRGDDSAAIVGVIVRVPELHLTVTSNERGEFQLSHLSMGRLLLQLRRIGLAPLDTIVQVSDHPGAVLALVLNVAPTALDTVNVQARLPSTAAIPEFESRRERATGRLITREELRAMDSRDFVDVLRARVPGLLFQRAPYGMWAYSPSQQAPQALNKNVGKPCYTQVIVDRVVLYQATDLLGVNPPDISEYLTGSLDGVEYYASPSRTPPEFRTSGASCGTLVLWRRRR